MSAYPLPAEAPLAPAQPALSLLAPPATRPLCPHCNVRVVSTKRRGLCCRCWRDRAVRDQYPRDPRGNRPPHADRAALFRRRPRRTDATPGSPEKVAALEARYLERRRFWGAGDRQEWEGEPWAEEAETDRHDVYPPVEAWTTPGGGPSPGLVEALARWTEARFGERCDIAP